MKLYYCIICFLGITFLTAQESEVFEETFVGDSSTTAQEKQSKFKIGLSGGMTFNSVNQNLSNLAYSKYSGKSSYFTNAYVEYRFKGPFIVSSGLSLMQKNYMFERSGAYEGVYTKFKSSYLNLPLMVGAYLINPNKEKGFKLLVSAGGYIGHWLSLKRSGQNISFPGYDYNEESGEFYSPFITYDEKYDFDKNENNFKRFEYGLQGDIKAIYDISNSLGFTLGYSYKYGLSNIYKSQKNEHPMRNRTSIVYIGALYKL